ncbi:MAG: ankyrin repeat domain-containing protein [Sphingobacteriia bacterium]|nr:ankyrin repeat domain-containing protein [Sphingobacteriia bacterium]
MLNQETLDLKNLLDNFAKTQILDEATAENLIQNGADIEVISSELNILTAAIKAKSLNLTQFLINHGVNVNKCIDQTNSSPLFHAIYNKCYPIGELLIQNGANVNHQDIEANTAFFHLFFFRDQLEDWVNLLINNGADVTIANRYGNTPLHVAINYPNTPIPQLLINNGADKEAKNIFGDTPLFTAVKNKNLAGVELMLNNGAELDVVNNDDITPLHFAAEIGCPVTVEALINLGADVNKQDDLGRTPLYKSALTENSAAAEVLIQNNADLELTDVLGQKPIEIAFIINNVDTKEVFKTYVPTEEYTILENEYKDENPPIENIEGVNNLVTKDYLQ